MTAPNEYRVWTLADMARIPDEAMPRFLAELPVMLQTLKEIQARVPAIARTAERPLWLRWASNENWEAIIARGFLNANRTVWIDDDKGVATVTIRNGDAVIFQQSEKVMP